MNVRYCVELSQAERGQLNALLSGGKHAARKLKRAQILLAAAAGSSDEEIARTVAVGGSTVYRTKRRFVEVPHRALPDLQRMKLSVTLQPRRRHRGRYLLGA